MVINLVKKRERRAHESLLSEEFVTHIDYLNQFLPELHRIQYVHFDMARSVGPSTASTTSTTIHYHQQLPPPSY